MSSSMAPSSRQSQPRRKTSSTSSATGSRQDSSWEVLERNQRQSIIDEDAMDTDDYLIPSLQSMAERVGKEVEMFAEELDKFMTEVKRKGKVEAKDVVVLVEKYKRTADETVARLQRQHESGHHERFQRKWNVEDDANMSNVEDFDAPTTIDDLERWTAEKQTWQLFQVVLELDYPGIKFNDEAHKKTNDRFTADKSTWTNFLESSDTARERLRILKWLESTAEITGKDVELIEDQISRKYKRGAGLLYGGWMDTRERIKAAKRLRFTNTPSHSGLPLIEKSDGLGLLVTELDPDSVTRQGRALEKPDEIFERGFWTICWEMQKRGYSMDKILEWCAEKNEVARAFSIGAQIEDGTAGQSLRQRWLWRQACTFAARNGLNNHERGVYGLLCGVSRAVEPICQGWSDFLFVEYNTRLLQQYESYLATQHRSEFLTLSSGLFKSPSQHRPEADRLEIAQNIVASLDSNPASRVDVANPFQRVQAALIAHNIYGLIFYQGVSLARRAKEDKMGELKHLDAAKFVPAEEEVPDLTDDPDILRVIVHLYLIYRELGVDFEKGLKMDAIENALCDYIRYLLDAGKIHLIPLYASQLSHEWSMMVLARCLPGIRNQQEQREFVSLIAQTGIDVPEVLTFQAHLAMRYSRTVIEPGAPISRIELLEPVEDHKWPGFRLKPCVHQDLRPSEETLIRSMEWFKLVEGGWARMFQNLTEISIALLKSSRINVALELYKRLPFADISVFKKPAHFHQPVDILDDSDDDDETTAAAGDKAPALRYATSLSFRAYRHFGTPVGLAPNPAKTKVQRELYKAHARTYFELGQLVEGLRALYHWRDNESAYITLQQSGSITSKAKHDLRMRLDQLVHAMEPLLHEILVRPSPYVDPPSVLQELRRKFVPQMVLAYSAALQSAGFLMSREHLLQALDLATDVADCDELIADFKAVGEMGRLVDTFALASKSMLKMNELAGNNKSMTKKRGQSGRTMGIWDVS